jgi:hypothetical protein
VAPRDVPIAAPRSPSSLLGPEPAEEEPGDFDAFAHEPPFRPRRNWAKIWTIAAIVAAVLMLGATAAISAFGVPDFGGRLALAKGEGTPLRFADQRTARSRMESGNVLLTVTGRVVNPSQETQRVPTIRAELRDAAGRTLVQWMISPPAPRLAPGQSATFNSAEVGVPDGAQAVRLTFGPLG